MYPMTVNNRLLASQQTMWPLRVPRRYSQCRTPQRVGRRIEEVDFVILELRQQPVLVGYDLVRTVSWEHGNWVLS